MSMRESSQRRTICEMLREINDLHQGDTQIDLSTRALLHEAMDAAKRMDHKLKEYSQEWDADWWAANPDYSADLDRRLAVDYLSLDDSDVPRAVRAIPSMGGREIGRYLREWAAAVPAGHSIVELGAWLGAGTAQMALGVRQSGRDVWIHSFDRFEAGAGEVAKAAAHGVRLESGQSTIGIVAETLQNAGLYDRVLLRRGDVRKAKWGGDERIALHVDDACKRDYLFLPALRTFGPSWVPGLTVVVLMDFWYFERSNDPGLRFQYDWMFEHCACFETIRERMPGTSAAAFRYLGGEPWR